MEFIGLRAARVVWTVSSFPFFYSVQYSMERKSTKRRLTGRRTQSGYELKVRELFESIFRVIMIFFLNVVDSNTCDKIRTIRARITCNNARNIDLRYLKGY